jgi:hypothetical protein
LYFSHIYVLDFPFVVQGSGRMSLDEQTEFARRFSVGYERVLPDGRLWKDTARVQRVRAMCSEYNARLKQFGLRDYQASHPAPFGATPVLRRASTGPRCNRTDWSAAVPVGPVSALTRQVAHVMCHMGRSRAICTVALRICILLAFTACWVPMTLLWLPLLVISRSVSAFKAKEALSRSKVKIAGRDVAATWKVIVALIMTPMLWLGYTALASLLSTGWAEPWPRELPLLVKGGHP